MRQPIIGLSGAIFRSVFDTKTSLNSVSKYSSAAEGVSFLEWVAQHTCKHVTSLISLEKLSEIRANS